MSATRCGPIPLAFAERIWRVLVEECGVRDGTYYRWSFICGIVNIKGDQVYSWSWPLADGEFYDNLFVWRVRDYCGRRTAMVAAANARLDELRREFMEGRHEN